MLANTRAALYARYSSDNQRSESIDAQLRAMHEYCGQKGIVITETYIDEAKSATTDRRPAFQQMISDSAGHTFDMVLVHKLDRFARSRYQSSIYRHELKKNGVLVYSVLENLDDSPESIMLESVLEGLNEYYSKNLAREVRKGMMETAYQCKHTGGKPPLGYDVDPVTRRLAVNEEEAVIVRCIFEMYARGCGYSEILDTLNTLGYKTKNGNYFMKNSLYSILTNPKYQGIYVFNRSSAKSIYDTRNTHLLKSAEEIITIDDGCPRLVDDETFTKVQSRIDANKHKGGKCNAKHRYLLSGKVYCNECGRAMVGNARRSGRDKSVYITYRCPGKKCSCSNREINRQYLERYVVSLLEKQIFNTGALKAIEERMDKHSQRQEAESEKETARHQEMLQATEDAIANITGVIMSGIVSQSLTDKLSELEAEKVSIEADITRTRFCASLQERPVNSTELLREYTEVKDVPASPAYKAFIQRFIDRIEVGRYVVAIRLKTGLGCYAALDTLITVRRQEIYSAER